ncbi:MAG: acyl--CoA ligase [candidate division Zixibacteria bacterium]|nr:acyl--CoA ligase [candidate division Zixibacteria bacterium]
MRLFDLLRRGAANSPDKIAVTHGDIQISYSELLSQALTLLQHLKNLSIDSGDRVAIMLENSVDYIIAYFAVTGAGYIVVPLDTSLKPEKCGYILKDCEAKALIIQKKYTRHINIILDNDSTVKHVISDRKLDLSEQGITCELWDDAMMSDVKPDISSHLTEIEKIAPMKTLRHDNLGDCPHELAAIFYTSGSTGSPKGVMLSHRNLVSNTVATIEYLKLTSDDSIITILPFYYIYGNSLLLTHLVSGGRVVIDNRFAFPQVILETMAREKVTGFSGVPSNFMILLTNTNFISAGFPKLRYLTQAGGGMAPEIISRVMGAFPSKEIYIMYGQTEASPRITYLPSDMLKKNIGSIGIPVPGVTIKLMSEEGNEVPEGEVGEIAVLGDCVMMGYWNQPDEQEQVLKDGWLYTGDLAKRDANGLLFIVSRKKEIMKVGGNRVSAKEVEEKILELDEIQEVAVISVPDDILGEAIKAVIVCKNGQDSDVKKIQNYCKAGLAMHKVPKFVEFIDELPKYQSGKVNKQELSRGSKT